MNLKVLPLRVLVSRQVIRDRMDYTGYLAGKTKSEMDILDRLAGKFEVQTSEKTVERYFGDKEDKDKYELGELDEWEMSVGDDYILNGTADISIVETSSSGARNWVISDVDGFKKSFLLESKGYMLLEPERWYHIDSFIEDGKLMTKKKVFMMEGNKVALDEGHQGLVLDYFDSFSTDKMGNLVREFILIWPDLDIKITKVMSALRVV